MFNYCTEFNVYSAQLVAVSKTQTHKYREESKDVFVAPVSYP
jgi:hypothetical protein